MIFEGATPGIKFALGENPKRAGNPQRRPRRGHADPARYPATRMGVEEVIREAFNDAKDYKAAWDDYNAKVAKRREAAAAAQGPEARSRWRRCSRASATSTPTATAPTRS